MNCVVCSIAKWNPSRYAKFFAVFWGVWHFTYYCISSSTWPNPLFEITYVECGEIEVEKKIDEKIEQFIRWIEKHPNKKSQPTKSPIGKSHHSKLVMDTGEASEERSSRRTLLEQSLQEVLFQIIKFVNEKKDHVPPINDGVIYYSFEITIPSSSDLAFGMDMIKRMLHSLRCSANSISYSTYVHIQTCRILTTCIFPV